VVLIYVSAIAAIGGWLFAELFAMTFSCAHIDLATEYCRRLKCTCVPGRRGCVLRGKVAFAIPAEERIAMLEREARSQRSAVSRSKKRRPNSPHSG
jgi:hypothetical protein